MTVPKITNVNPDAVELSLEVIVAEEDMSVYVKIAGFETIEEADSWRDELKVLYPNKNFIVAKVQKFEINLN
jgi:hypothetical protein